MINLGQAWLLLVAAFTVYIFWPRTIEDSHAIILDGEYIDTDEVTW